MNLLWKKKKCESVEDILKGFTATMKALEDFSDDKDVEAKELLDGADELKRQALQQESEAAQASEESENALLIRQKLEDLLSPTPSD